MPMTVTYTTINGQNLSESRDGVVSHFIPDPLGSVVMVRDALGKSAYEAEYSPFGTVQCCSGINPSHPEFCDTLDYIPDPDGTLFARVRGLEPTNGRWQSRDFFWSAESAHCYTDADPIFQVDPSGRAPSWQGCQAEVWREPSHKPVRHDRVIPTDLRQNSPLASTDVSPYKPPKPKSCKEGQEPNLTCYGKTCRWFIDDPYSHYMADCQECCREVLGKKKPPPKWLEVCFTQCGLGVPPSTCKKPNAGPTI